ncbi:MAG: CC/Se motif family (seleno)protein [Bacillota bacterium]|nr:CC/Se motif family (seleno)protein [Bacillota bacterium]MDP4161257.1 CC/Se motif family (seleno)protein [Bacillota bacterium]
MDLELKANMKMKINITQKAMDYLQKAKKIELYIERFVVTDCCVPLSTPPSVRKGRPRKPEDFYAYNVEGITVYYDRNLINKSALTIDAQGFGFAKGLFVSDWIIKY